ncbi:MAG: hypothetical protein ACJ76A_03520 [Actinomycetota bacterium]|jgi:hypothetical protein
MRKLFGITAISALVLAIPFAAPAQASGDTTMCTGALHPGTYHRVVVPDNAVCLSAGPVRILAGLWIQPGATFVLGSEEHPGSTGVINAGVHATDPASVQIHFATINGGLRIHGGSGPFGPPFDVTWNAIEDNQIHGGVWITGYTGFWMGFIRNHVSGGVTLANNTLADPDGNEYVTNTIHGPMRCWGNDPAPQVGDSQGDANTVTGPMTGQCADL